VSYQDDIFHEPEPAELAPVPESPLASFEQFTRAMYDRLALGEKLYPGNATLRKPLPAIADALAEELFDVANYALLAWVRLRALRARLDAVERAAAPVTTMPASDDYRL
jgi:hypothetical protein